MAVTITATPGAADANAYDTLANATAYFAEHPSSATWTGLASDDVRSQYLILATTLIDTECIDGDKYDTSTTSGAPDQALRFPRVEDYIDATLIIPQAVKYAMYEQALNMATTGATSTRADLQNQGVVEIQTPDGAREKYGEGGGSATQLCTRARQFLINAGLIKTVGAWL